MTDCCLSDDEARNLDEKVSAKQLTCSGCGQIGKAVQTVTLKCLLKAEAMPRLEQNHIYHFCLTPACPVVYYSSTKPFWLGDLQVPVFQKDEGLETPVCYCFGILRSDMQVAVEGRREELIELVRALTKDRKCACEYRNPQGSCCLGNLATVRLSHANQ